VASTAFAAGLVSPSRFASEPFSPADLPGWGTISTPWANSGLPALVAFSFAGRSFGRASACLPWLSEDCSVSADSTLLDSALV
jgi:hypothetical protein